MASDWTYIFHTEDGTLEMTYQQYLKNEELRIRIGDRTSRRFFLDLGKQLLSYDAKWLNDKPDRMKMFNDLVEQKRKNPLRFYLPCCARSGFNSPWHQYINDIHNVICLFVLGNRGGKTTAMWIKQLVARGLIKCDPTWEIFRLHGIRYVDYLGPRQIAMGTYEWDNHRTTIWPQVIQAWTPMKNLGVFSKDGSRAPNFASTPHVDIQTGNGKDISTVFLRIYDQPQNVWESQRLSGIAWDEQPPQAKFDGGNQRCAQTRNWYRDASGQECIGSGWHDMGFTPHKVAGRKYTGAGGWLQQLALNKGTMGMSCGTYSGNLIYDVPDWIYPERVKQEQLEGWIRGPRKTGNLRRLREGQSRLLGKFHITSNRVHEDWDRNVHLVPAFNIPQSWTFYRALDHGYKHKAVCLFAGVSPVGFFPKSPDESFVFLYSMLVLSGITPDQIVSRIVSHSGNSLDVIAKQTDRSGGIARMLSREVFTERYVYKTVLDSRAMKAPTQSETGTTLGDLYRRGGLTTLSPASGQPDAKSIPVCAMYLKVDPALPHPITGAKGSPRVFVFDSAEMQPFAEQIENLSFMDSIEDSDEERPAKEKIRTKQEDDIMDAFKYMMQIPPVFMRSATGDLCVTIRMKHGHSNGESGWKRDPITGY